MRTLVHSFFSLGKFEDAVILLVCQLAFLLFHLVIYRFIDLQNKCFCEKYFSTHSLLTLQLFSLKDNQCTVDRFTNTYDLYLCILLCKTALPIKNSTFNIQSNHSKGFSTFLSVLSWYVCDSECHSLKFLIIQNQIQIQFYSRFMCPSIKNEFDYTFQSTIKEYLIVFAWW